MKNTQIRLASLALVLTASAASGCDGASDGGSSDGSSMTATIGALKAAVAGCAEARDACESDTAEAVATDCKAQFEGCKDEALAAAMPSLDKGVKECAETSHSCKQTAATAEAKAACTDVLKTCVDDSNDKIEVDASSVEVEHASPVAVCTDALHSCIEGDGEAKGCTDALRSCLSTTLPNHANGKGKDRADASTPRGASDEEHGNKPLDAGLANKPVKPVSTLDAGTSDERANNGKGPKS